MKVSHECPISLLKDSRGWNDYDYALVHLFEQYPDYYEFFVESLKKGRTVLLDNSIFELGIAFDSKKFAEWIQKLKPTEYIIPDALEDYPKTTANAEKWIEKYDELPGKKIGVVQGKTKWDIQRCAWFMRDCVNIDKVAISFNYSYYCEDIPHPNKLVSWMIGRIKLINELIEEGLLGNKPVHLLGCALPQEFLYYRDSKFDFIESMDSSNPVVHGIKSIPYESYGLLQKESIKLYELIDYQISPEELKIVTSNIKQFKKFCK